MFFVGCDRWGCDVLVDFFVRIGADPDKLAFLVKLYRDQFDGD
jgi:hypothetical protein